MKYRPLGTSGIDVSPICLGCNVFGWTIDQPTSHTILDAFTSAGFNFLDTADVYSAWHPGNKGGESETIIGNWLKRTGKRPSVVLATKVGMELSPTKKGLSKNYILQAVEDSLRRLQTDHIDLYQAHKDDPTTPLDETLSAFAKLIDQGKVRAIGASNYSADRLGMALHISAEEKLPAFESLQPHYNLLERADYETNLESVCLENRLGVIPYFSLAAGFLTGKYRSEADFSKSARGKGMAKHLNPRGHRILAALDSLAEKHKATPARIALAWLLARPSITAPIVSATSIPQLQEILKSATLKLDESSIEQLNTASAP